MDTIAHVADKMQIVFAGAANDIAREVGFVQRARKIDGSSFVQTMVTACLENPSASYTDLIQNAASVGVVIRPRAIQPVRPLVPRTEVQRWDASTGL